MKKTFIFYTDWIDYTKEMTREEKGLFLEAILSYQNGEALPNDMGAIKFIWTRIQKQLDEDNKKWSEELDKRKEAGKLGGLAKASKDKQVLASASSGKQLLADNDNENVNENKNNIKQELEEFLEKWNKGFGKDYKLTPDLETTFLSIRKKYSLEDLNNGARRYYELNSKRTNEEKKQYELHIYKFLKQKNGFISYI